MAPRWQVRLQSLVLLALVPTLLLVTALYGYSNYSALYDDILRGFDRKLRAIGTLSAAFIDGDEHERLVRPREIHGIVNDSAKDQLLGVDRRSSILVSINPSDGSAEEIVKIASGDVGSKVSALAFDSKRNTLFALLDGADLVVLDRVTGSTSKATVPAGAWTAIAYQPTDDSLYLFGEDVAAIGREAGKVRSFGKAPVPGISGVVARSGGEFLALVGASGELYRLHGTPLQADRIGLMIAEKPAEPQTAAPEMAAADIGATETGPADEAEQWKEPEVVTLPAHGLAALQDGTLRATTDRLLPISSETGEAKPAGFRMGFRNDFSKLYRSYSVPMKRIMDELGLTYHYTTILPREDQLIYVLDATEGEDHSTSGTEEEVEHEEWTRLNAVMTSGVPSQSPIQQFDIWGLLKVGTSPILNSRGEVVGLAGADVNISVIQKKTRVALLQVLLVGALSLILAIVASLAIAKRLISPLHRLREGALQVAAGKYERAIDVQSPKELRKLAAHFNEIREALCSKIQTLADENARFEVHRTRHELIRLLAAEQSAELPEHRTKVSVSFSGAQAEFRESSGWIQHGSQALIWLASSPEDGLRALQLRSDIRTICGRLLELYSRDWNELRARLAQQFREEVYLFVLLDTADNRVFSLARKPTHATLALAGFEEKSVILAESSELALTPGSTFVVSSLQLNGTGAQANGAAANGREAKHGLTGGETSEGEAPPQMIASLIAG